MKKHSFYSLMRVNGKTTAVLQEGYSDGTYYYYKNGGQWSAIHPLIGLSVTYGYTRKECAEKAHAPELFKKVIEISNERGEQLTADFEKAIQALKEVQRNEKIH